MHRVSFAALSLVYKRWFLLCTYVASSDFLQISLEWPHIYFDGWIGDAFLRLHWLTKPDELDPGILPGSAGQ